MSKAKNTHRAYVILHGRHKMIASGSNEFCSDVLARKFYEAKESGTNIEGGVVPYDFEGDPWKKEWNDYVPPDEPPPAPKLRSVDNDE